MTHAALCVAIREVEADVDINLQRAQAMRQATLSKVFSNGESNG